MNTYLDLVSNNIQRGNILQSSIKNNVHEKNYEKKYVQGVCIIHKYLKLHKCINSLHHEKIVSKFNKKNNKKS